MTRVGKVVLRTENASLPLWFAAIMENGLVALTKWERVGPYTYRRIG